MTQYLRELAEWLRLFGVTQVAMESNGQKTVDSLQAPHFHTSRVSAVFARWRIPA